MAADRYATLKHVPVHRIFRLDSTGGVIRLHWGLRYGNGDEEEYVEALTN